MKIKTIKDIVDASNRIIEHLVTKKQLVSFALMVDHGDGSVSNCSWTPTSTVGPRLAPIQQFIAVDDYSKILLLLWTHPRIRELEYDEARHTVFAMFMAKEMEEIDRIENPEEEF